jgi:two-component system nitrogen regulation sensor histidine kinase NtrY
MDYKRFSFQVILRIFIIIITVLLGGYLYFNTTFYFTASAIIGLATLQGYWLVKLVNKTNRQLSVFLDSIKYAEFNRTFQPAGLGESFDGLSESFNNVLNKFHAIRKEKEEQFFFYQNIIQHIGISLLAFDSLGKILLLNNAGKKLFQCSKTETLQNLKNFSNEFVELIQSMKNNERRLLKIIKENDFLHLSIHIKQFKIEKKEITIVSVQNIESELEQTEVDAWQKLIRVLTHEIMNSITPISSLSSTLNGMIDHWNQETNPDEVIPDVQMALKTIQKRSDGLLNFVQTYRSLTKIPVPNFEIVQVAEFLYNLYNLLTSQLTKEDINVHIDVNPKNIEITADRSMMEQVLLNLIKNAMHAVRQEKKKKIEIKSFYGNYGNVIIQVIDNGQGILPDVLEKIFVPFFTTKQTGSGIGLSLSRQLIRAQGGNISATSEPGNTVFTIRF